MSKRELVGLILFCVIAFTTALTFTFSAVNAGESAVSSVFWGAIGGFSLAWLLFEVGFAIFYVITFLIYGAPLNYGQQIEISNGLYKGALAEVRYHSGQLITASLTNDSEKEIIVLKRKDVRGVGKTI